jgi:hypothetical protein
MSEQTPDKEVKISHLFVHDSGHTEPDPTSELSPDVWSNKRGLFVADSLVRHFLIQELVQWTERI